MKFKFERKEEVTLKFQYSLPSLCTIDTTPKTVTNFEYKNKKTIEKLDDRADIAVQDAMSI